jgi:hypothetical protein
MRLTVERLDLGHRCQNVLLNIFCRPNAQGHLHHVSLEQMLKVKVEGSDLH